MRRRRACGVEVEEGVEPSGRPQEPYGARRLALRGVVQGPERVRREPQCSGSSGSGSGGGSGSGNGSGYSRAWVQSGCVRGGGGSAVAEHLRPSVGGGARLLRRRLRNRLLHAPAQLQTHSHT